MIRERRPGEQQASFAPVAAQMLVTYKAGKANCCRRFCCERLLWSYREFEAREELRYALLRDRFIAPRGGPVATSSLQSDFEFSGYLRREMSHTVAHVLHVGAATWLSVIAYLFIIIEVPLALERYGHIDVNVFHVIGLGWGLWLLCCLLQALAPHRGHAGPCSSPTTYTGACSLPHCPRATLPPMSPTEGNASPEWRSCAP